MNTRASIDIGSNSINLLIAEVGSEIKPIISESKITGLGRELDKNKKFINIAMEDSFQVLSEYADVCKGKNISLTDVVVTATEASRVSENAESFFNKIKKEIGLDIITISGEAEAYYSATGLLCDEKVTADIVTIMDIGGASTELIQVNRQTREIAHSFSMPIGVVRMNNWKSENLHEEQMLKIYNDFDSDLKKVSTRKLFCVAGTMTSVANMHMKNKKFIEEEVNGHEMSKEQFSKMCSDYKSYSAAMFLEEFPFLGKRSVTIFSGLELALSIFKHLGVQDIYTSTYGIRYGTLLAGKIKDEYVWKRN